MKEGKTCTMRCKKARFYYSEKKKKCLKIRKDDCKEKYRRLPGKKDCSK